MLSTPNWRPWRRMDAAARTHAGKVRTNNEDALLCKPEEGLFAVVDGMARGGNIKNNTLKMVFPHIGNEFTVHFIMRFLFVQEISYV